MPPFDATRSPVTATHHARSPRRSHPLWALLASVALASPLAGCASKRAGYVGGGVLAVAGGALIIEARRDDCGDDELFACASGSAATGALGVAALVVGLGILIAAAATDDPPAAPASASGGAPNGE